MKYRIKFTAKQLSDMIQNRCKEDIGEISDGYHTFNELYEHRMFLFSIICKQNRKNAWRSKLHADGTMYENFFIVGISTPNGDYSYHYHMDDWDYFFGIRTLERAPDWDGHMPKDINRLFSLLKNPPEVENTAEKDIEKDTQNEDLGGYI